MTGTETLGRARHPVTAAHSGRAGSPSTPQGRACHPVTAAHSGRAGSPSTPHGASPRDRRFVSEHSTPSCFPEFLMKNSTETPNVFDCFGEGSGFECTVPICESLLRPERKIFVVARKFLLHFYRPRRFRPHSDRNRTKVVGKANRATPPMMYIHRGISVSPSRVIMTSLVSPFQIRLIPITPRVITATSGLLTVIRLSPNPRKDRQGSRMFSPLLLIPRLATAMGIPQ